MFTLIKGAEVYAPEYLGVRDVLISFDRIAGVSDSIHGLSLENLEVIEAHGKILIPGLIDQHVHIIGGGGEGGFDTRTKEIEIESLLKAGITTVVGVLGTDGITRNLEELYAKAKDLEIKGVTTYIYTGSYGVPPVTFTGRVDKDLLLIDKVVGVGEIAISDHRSSHPTESELVRIASQARVGGLLSGKAGIVHLHMGDHSSGLDMIMHIVKNTAIPSSQFIPTHINRNRRLLAQGIDFCRMGGRVDLTAGFVEDDDSSDCIPAWKALDICLSSNMDIDNISMSSDGNGSMPVFDEYGNMVSIETASCQVLFKDLKRMIEYCNIPIDIALKTVTINPARILKIDNRKGAIKAGWDADCLLLDENLEICAVFTKGKKVLI